ncbi:MAG: hypothetical protein PHE15_00735 [Dehalococcoidales bacterium]|nr:hypothetical protein [Dehalococcoidales bacterium]
MKKRIINILLAFTLVITGTIGASGIGVMSMISKGYSVSSSGITTIAANPPEWVAYTIGYNIQYLWAYISPTSSSNYILQQTLTTSGQSILVLCIFCILFILASFYIFRKQDLTAE